MRQIKDFKQGRDFAGLMKQEGVASGGVCAAMSLHYLICAKEMKDFWPWLAKDKNSLKVVKVHGGGKEPRIYMDEIYKTMDSEFTRTGSHIGRVHELFNMMMTDVDKGDGDYRWVSFTAPKLPFGDPPSHAVGLVREYPGLRFMDPNHGEWEFADRNEFAPWIGSFFREHYHKWFYDGTIEIQFLDDKT